MAEGKGGVKEEISMKGKDKDKTILKEKKIK